MNVRQRTDPAMPLRAGSLQQEHHMNLSLTPLVSLAAGVLILVMPRLLNYIVAFYLIAIGILGLVGDVRFR